MLERPAEIALLCALGAFCAAGGCRRASAPVQAPGPAASPAEPAPKAGEPGPGIPEDLGSMTLVSEGWFVMGDDQGKPFERPAHKVFVDSFYMDIYEVSNLQYAKFVKSAGHPPPPHWAGESPPAGRDLHPVTNVTWDDACAYAAWAGKRLPTEAEWEYACRGPESRKFAYGNEFDPKITNSADSGICDTSPVDAFPEGMSPFACYNMTGNVWEWVSDWFTAGGYAKDGQKNPQGPPCGTMHISKGGSWTTDSDSCRAAYKCRSLPGSRWGYAGIRCARPIRKPSEIPRPTRDMVLIPAGHFLMGSDDYLFEFPQRRIFLDAFLIDRLPATNRSYKDFCDATGHAPPPHWESGRFPEGEGDHPVVNVSIEDARAFAAWAGKRLPTEAEWEKAARGVDGRIYPWGNEFDASRCNTEYSRIGHTTPVGSYPQSASPFGVIEMCGNIWEWVEGFWNPEYFEEMPERNPKGPARGEMNVLRGGTWSTHPLNCRTFSRCPALKGCLWGYCGFRCASGLDPGGAGEVPSAGDEGKGRK